jgi:hypothetical protein
MVLCSEVCVTCCDFFVCVLLPSIGVICWFRSCVVGIGVWCVFMG